MGGEGGEGRKPPLTLAPRSLLLNRAETLATQAKCLYENLMSNTLKKNMNCKLKVHSKGFYQQILGAVTVLKFLQTVF